MKHPINQVLAQRVYTLCYRITACRKTAAAIAVEALTGNDPLHRAVQLALSRSVQPDSPLPEEALFALSQKQRAALLLLDSLHLPLADAARWAEIPEKELLALAHSARNFLINNK